MKATPVQLYLALHECLVGDDVPVDLSAVDLPLDANIHVHVVFAKTENGPFQDLGQIATGKWSIFKPTGNTPIPIKFRPAKCGYYMAVLKGLTKVVVATNVNTGRPVYKMLTAFYPGSIVRAVDCHC